MERLPENLGTKEDILYFVAEAKTGKFDQAELKRRLQGMYDTHRHWVFSKEAPGDVKVAAGEKIMQIKDGEATTHVCFAQLANVRASFRRAGIEELELQNLINQL